MRWLLGETKTAQRASKALGWYSVVLGATQILKPEIVARMSGLDDRGGREVIRFTGFRELITGVGILARPRDPRWLWVRLAGDVIDLAFLGYKVGTSRSRLRLLGSMASVLALTAVDGMVAANLQRPARWRSDDAHPPLSKRHRRVRKSVVVERSCDDLYRFWHQLENLPRVMSHIESVQTVDDVSHWRAKGPAGMAVEWDAEIHDDVPGQRISWRSLGDAVVPNEGTVRFVPARGGRATQVIVELAYDPPLGALGTLFAGLLGDAPGKQIQADLKQFKTLVESGELKLSEAATA